MKTWPSSRPTTSQRVFWSVMLIIHSEYNRDLMQRKAGSLITPPRLMDVQMLFKRGILLALNRHKVGVFQLIIELVPPKIVVHKRYRANSDLSRRNCVPVWVSWGINVANIGPLQKRGH